MRSTSLRLAPFSAIELPQLLLMADLPVAWSDYFFQLHLELSSRDFPDKPLVLERVKLKFLTAYQREGGVALDSMVMESPKTKPAGILDQAAFSDCWSRGRYEPLIGTVLAHLLKPVAGENALAPGLVPTKPNKKSMVEFARSVVEKMTPHEKHLMGDQLWMYEKLKKIVATETPARSASDVLSASAEPKRIASTAPQIPSDWNESAKKIRHAKVHGKVNEISRHRGDNDWADVSPLKMLGYSVDAKEGLSDKDRMEFLVDFCENMILPLGLPRDYVEPWGDPGTKKRILKTAKHLAFVRRNFERQDLEKYARAIACWQRDFNFLQSNYKQMQINPMDWATAAKG